MLLRIWEDRQEKRGTASEVVYKNAEKYNPVSRVREDQFSVKTTSQFQGSEKISLGEMEAMYRIRSGGKDKSRNKLNKCGM